MFDNETLFKPFHGRRIFEEISDRIKKLIFEGNLNVGDHLPTETQMAKYFDVSRSTIREAYRLLEISGFITISRGGTGGPVISDTIFHRISELYGDALQMKKVSLHDLTVARLEIEKDVLEHLFLNNNISPTQIATLRSNVQQANSKIEKGQLAIKENLEFHRLIAKYTGNHVFVIIVESLIIVLGDLLSRLGPDLNASAKTIKEHEQIIEAINKGNKKNALLLMENHLHEVENRLKVFSNL